VGALEGFDEDGQEFAILPLFRCEFLGAPVEILQLGDEPLILLLGTNNRRELARQWTALTLWIYLDLVKRSLSVLMSVGELAKGLATDDAHGRVGLAPPITYEVDDNQYVAFHGGLGRPAATVRPK
jgi:hypothetical protein